MAASSSADMSPPAIPPPAQAGRPPFWARPAVILINLFDRYDALLQRVERFGFAEDHHALADLSVIVQARIDAEYIRWRGQMRMSCEQQDRKDFDYWFDGSYQLFLAQGRRDRNLWLECGNLFNPAARQPAARGEQDESTPSTERLHPGYHWPQPEAHGPHLFQFGSSWRFRGDLGLGRYATL